MKHDVEYKHNKRVKLGLTWITTICKSPFNHVPGTS